MVFDIIVTRMSFKRGIGYFFAHFKIQPTFPFQCLQLRFERHHCIECFLLHVHTIDFFHHHPRFHSLFFGHTVGFHCFDHNDSSGEFFKFWILLHLFVKHHAQWMHHHKTTPLHVLFMVFHPYLFFVGRGCFGGYCGLPVVASIQRWVPKWDVSKVTHLSMVCMVVVRGMLCIHVECTECTM